ncbi:hypothetical protein ACFQE8_04070 [Salinirubellus sp. GCM10025818]|uniref:hypothetical protein n=1 Tax=Salinirubellus TaxID=2162630 RepID=UPI0030CB1BB6
MLSLDDIREFFLSYQNGDAYSLCNTTPQLGQPPSDWVRKRQQSTVGTSDGHVIPIADFEFRIEGEDDRHGDDPRFVRYEDAIPFVEKEWDLLIEQYGLNGVSTYVPFHEDLGTYGIYIQQRGIRHLGHLLYHWSRVGSLTTTREEATEFLLENDLQNGDRLFRGDPQFETLEDAFALAQEVLVRHQWFHHQFELLAAHVEDAANTLYYPAYHQQYLSVDAIATAPEEALANAYVARSQACAAKAPSGLYQPLLRRALAGRQSNSPSFTDYINDFPAGCYEASRYLLAGGATSPAQRGTALARELVFETDIPSAVPSRISVYFTRSEPDSDNSSYAPGVGPLDQTYTISRDKKWKKAYRKADGTLKNLADGIEDKAKNKPRTLDKKGQGQGPKNQFYGYLNNNKRYIYEIDNSKEHIHLLEFGDHDLPRKYGLYKS